MTEIITRVKRQFGDEASVQVTDQDIYRWANDGMREIAQQNDLLETVSTANVVANQAEYTLPSDLLTLRAVRAGNKKLDVLTLQQADDFITNYENPAGYQTGTPVCFWIWANKFTLYPTPDTASTGGLKVYYTRMPALVAAGGDVPELAVKYHPRIVEYILQQAYELDEDWAASGNKAAQFTQGLTNLKESDSWTERSAYPTITTLPEDLGFY